jgi:hypothetical protein
MPGLFKNVPNPFKESQVSAYTQKLSIAKKLKQKKITNFLESKQNAQLFREFEKS